MKLCALGIALIWTIVAGARFLPPPREERAARFLKDCASRLVAYAKELGQSLLDAIRFLFTAITIIFILVAQIVSPFMVDRYPEGTDIISVIIVGILIMSGGLVAIALFARLLYPGVSYRLFKLGFGKEHVEALIVPLAKYYPLCLSHGHPKGDTHIALLKDGVFLLCHSIASSLFLFVMGIICVGLAFFSFLGLFLLASLELLFFPILLGARLGNRRGARETFILIGWLASLCGIVIGIVLELAG